MGHLLTFRASGPGRASIRQFGRSCWLCVYLKLLRFKLEQLKRVKGWQRATFELGGLRGSSPTTRDDACASSRWKERRHVGHDREFFFRPIPNTRYHLALELQSGLRRFTISTWLARLWLLLSRGLARPWQMSYPNSTSSLIFAN